MKSVTVSSFSDSSQLCKTSRNSSFRSYHRMKILITLEPEWSKWRVSWPFVKLRVAISDKRLPNRKIHLLENIFSLSSTWRHLFRVLSTLMVGKGKGLMLTATERVLQSKESQNLSQLSNMIVFKIFSEQLLFSSTNQRGTELSTIAAHNRRRVSTGKTITYRSSHLPNKW